MYSKDFFASAETDSDGKTCIFWARVRRGRESPDAVVTATQYHRNAMRQAGNALWGRTYECENENRPNVRRRPLTVLGRG